MKKRLLFIGLLGTILLGMSGCGKQIDVSSNIINSQVSNAVADESDSKDKQNTSEISANISLDAQYSLIAENKEQWYIPSTEEESYWYAVVDMNYDGMVEVIRTTCQGSGMFSVTNYWSVNIDATSLDEINQPFEEGDFGPDVLYGSMGHFAKDGENWFIFDDMYKDNMGFLYTKYALRLNGKDLVANQLGSYSEVYVESSSGSDYVFTYYDNDGNVIDFDAYCEIESTFFENLEADYRNFMFVEIEETEDVVEFLKTSYEAFCNSDIDACWNDGYEYDYQLTLYTEEASTAYQELENVEELNGIKDGNCKFRFSCNKANVQVSLEKIEWIDDINYFHPLEEVFEIVTKENQVYEFNGLVSESIPMYRLRVEEYGDSSFYYLQADGKGVEDGILTIAYEPRIYPEYGEGTPIMDICKAYAGMLVTAGDTWTLSDKYYWKTFGNAVMLHGIKNNLVAEDGKIHVAEWLFDSYMAVMFPYGYDWNEPDDLEPVEYTPDDYEKYAVSDALFYDEKSVELLECYETENGYVYMNFSVHGQTEEGVVIELAKDWNEENAFGYYIATATVCKG